MPSQFSSDDVSSPERGRKHKRKHRSKEEDGSSVDQHRKKKRKENRDDHGRHQAEHRKQRSGEAEARRPIKEEPQDGGYQDHSRERRHRAEEHRTRDRVRVKQERDALEEQRRERRHHDERRRQHRREQRGNPFSSQAEGEFGRQDDSQDGKPKEEKQKPNFGLSGKLTEDTNTFRGVVIKYNEPPEARKPRRRWRLYPFKGDEALPVLHIHRQSAYLLGRDRRVADIPIDHPSCSKQHAALQYRLVDFEREDGTKGRRVRLYVIDLGSANGTYVNNNRIEAQRYVELMEKDVVKFGFSSREYVLLPDNADTSELGEDVGEEDPS